MYTLIILIGLGLPVGEQIDQIVFKDFQNQTACENALAIIQAQSDARKLVTAGQYSGTPAMVCVPQKMKPPKV